MNRNTFQALLDLVGPSLTTSSHVQRYGQPRTEDLRRRLYSPRDILAMTIRFMVSKAPTKDLHADFGALQTSFSTYRALGMRMIVQHLVNDDRSKVYWDMSPEVIAANQQRTAFFDAIPGVVGFIDGVQVDTRRHPVYEMQRLDYSGRAKAHKRNMILVWDTYGKIIDCVLNTPGSYHDSRSTAIGYIYEHVTHLPDGAKIVADAAFCSTGEVEGKIVKVENYDEVDEAHIRASITSLRQSAEWGNNTLFGTFSRLQAHLPTCNVERQSRMHTSVLLHNWRAHYGEPNQIRSYFDVLEM